MIRCLRLSMILGLVATTALADRPPPEFFQGRYRVVGRDAATPPKLIDEDVRLEVAGKGLTSHLCGRPEGRMDYDSIFEADNFLHGGVGPWVVWCLYTNNGSNYPILNCGGDAGELFTLFPDEGGFAEPLDCGD
ncbi:hypothetical protein [Frigidibacter sp. ROC022]|uniref:hypothetical protein n=1 Tax=Frigidibacter sp. ROC022 TaxID=2971796 RepID=UPI00215ABB18|nr:hypothetical protein [Frigidibacter sp. ROC022]MCR8726306.1 hypothetical protein [Frigidibacter sp. ROC022]